MSKVLKLFCKGTDSYPNQLSKAQSFNPISVSFKFQYMNGAEIRVVRLHTKDGGENGLQMKGLIHVLQ